MKKVVLILMGMLLVTGIVQAVRTPEEQEQLDQDLITVVKEQNVEEVARLLDKGANPDCDVEGCSLLMFVLQKRFINIAILLVNAGANVNVESEIEDKKRTPLKSLLVTLCFLSIFGVETKECLGLLRLLVEKVKDIETLIESFNVGVDSSGYNVLPEDGASIIREEIEKRRRDKRAAALTFVQASHTRLGIISPARFLNKELFSLICRHL